LNGQSVLPVTVSEATRAAIRAGIESEANNTGLKLDRTLDNQIVYAVSSSLNKQRNIVLV
jgi:hypothetical protein